DLEIGGANRHGVDAHQDLGLAWNRHRLVLEDELTRIAEHPCLHGVGDRERSAGPHSGRSIHLVLLAQKSQCSIDREPPTALASGPPLVPIAPHYPSNGGSSLVSPI